MFDKALNSENFGRELGRDIRVFGMLLPETEEEILKLCDAVGRAVIKKIAANLCSKMFQANQRFSKLLKELPDLGKRIGKMISDKTWNTIIKKVAHRLGMMDVRGHENVDRDMENVVNSFPLKKLIDKYFSGNEMDVKVELKTEFLRLLIDVALLHKLAAIMCVFINFEDSNIASLLMPEGQLDSFYNDDEAMVNSLFRNFFIGDAKLLQKLVKREGVVLTLPITDPMLINVYVYWRQSPEKSS
jgi:Fe-S cluster biosynthesis and repair protein YggX